VISASTSYKWQKMYLHLLVSLGLCLMMSSEAAMALDPTKAITQYVHSSWRVEEGLPSNGVTKILETRDGYLWVGTQGGLARFDGVSFTTFDHTNTPSLRGDYIFDLAEDSQGTLWIATTNGGVGSLRDGRFDHLSTVESRGSHVLATDYDGSLWIGGYDGLKHFKNGVLVKAYGPADGLSGNPIRALVVDRNKTLWIGSPGGLNSLANGKMLTYSTQDGLPNKDVVALGLDENGTLRVKTQNSEFVRWLNDRFVPWHIPDVAGSAVRDVIRDRDGNYWLASGTEGLFRVKETKIDQFTTIDGLTNDAVGHLYEDHDGNLWVGTLGGLERFRDGSFTTFAKAEGFSDNGAYSVIEDSHGDIWTTGPDGLRQLHAGKVRIYRTSDKMLDAWSLWIDHASNLLVGTSKKLLQMIHGSLVPSPLGCAGIPPYIMTSILDGSDHQLWVTTLGGGLARCANGKLADLYTTSKGLLSNALYALAQGPDGIIWTGGDNGLNSIKDNQIRSYPKLNGLSNAWIVSLYFDSKNILWIGTFGQGLFRLENGHFTQYNTHTGIQSDTVYGIVEDSSNNLWLGSDKGISRITRKDLDAVATGSSRSVTPLAFGKADGMKSSSLSGGTQPNAWRAHDGRLWFPTERGVVVVDPARLKLSDNAPSSRIDQMIADETRVDLQNSMRLTPGTRRLEIRYTAPNLSSPERMLFRYRLEGFDERWIPGGPQRMAQYTNLSPGRYTFHVNAGSTSGGWSAQEATIGFELRPYFYQTAWFRLLCGFAVASLLWGAYRLRVSFLHARAAVLEERQRIARDIHDSLAQGLSAIIFHTQAAMYSLTKASDMTSTHMTSVLDLAVSSLDDARYSVWDLSPAVLDPKNLVESISSMAQLLARGRVEVLEIHSSGTEWPLGPAANHHVVLIAQEAISNAIQHGLAENISVNLEYESEALLLSVSDNGIGFTSNTEVGQRTRGYGMRNMQHRADLLGAELDVASTPGSGASISLRIRKLGRFKTILYRLIGKTKSIVSG